MNTEAIEKRILDDARHEAACILQDSRDRADAAKRDCERRIDERRVALNNQVESDIRTQRGRMLRMAELEQRKALLGAKREVIAQVFDTVLAALRSMPEPQRRAFNRRLLLSAAQGAERVICSARDASLFDAAFMDGVNALLAASGRAPVALSSERRETEGGFILAAQGVEVNCTYASVLAQRVPELEGEVSKMLFDAEG